jgi:hypothetical protein
MSNVPIPLADFDAEHPGIWGYVTWTDIDPRIDFFSIYVQGLTNSYQFEDEQGALGPGDPPLEGRTFSSKTLQLNFWRPGDSVFLHEGELRYGVPIDVDAARQAEILEQYGLKQRLDYLWVYR